MLQSTAQTLLYTEVLLEWCVSVAFIQQQGVSSRRNGRRAHHEKEGHGRCLPEEYENCEHIVISSATYHTLSANPSTLEASLDSFGLEQSRNTGKIK